MSADPINPNESLYVVWATQNISDTKHDGLNWHSAQNSLPIGLSVPKPLPEDEFLKKYLYQYETSNCIAVSPTDNDFKPVETLIRDGLLKDYHCFFYVPLKNGEESNVSASGAKRFSEQTSILDSILDDKNFKHKNIYVSKDFGFKAMQYDYTYFQKKHVYIGYTPAQENDAAGKPTLKSKNAFEYGFFSSDINVDFIWTAPNGLDTDSYIFPLTTNPEKPEKTCLKYNTKIQWDSAFKGPYDLKSETVFYDNHEISYSSNSEWTSKSDKEISAYEHFNNSAFQLLKRSFFALCSPKTAALQAIVNTDFDEFHSLAKRSGDALTAYIDIPNNKRFLIKNKVSEKIEEHTLTDFAFLYQTHDRLAAAGALTRSVDMVILEHPRNDARQNCFSLFFKKSLCDDKYVIDSFIENYNSIPRTDVTTGVDIYTQLDAKLKRDYKMITGDTDTYQQKLTEIVTVVLPNLINKIEIDTNITDDPKFRKYIRNSILLKRILAIQIEANLLVQRFNLNTINAEIDTINRYYTESNTTKITPSKNKETVRKIMQTIDTFINKLKTHMDMYQTIKQLIDFFMGIDEETIKRKIITKYYDKLDADLDKLKPFATLKTFATTNLVERISRNLNPFKIFTIKKNKFLFVLENELYDFGFPNFWLKYIDDISDSGRDTIYKIYQTKFLTARGTNEISLIIKSLSYVFKPGDFALTDFKQNLNDFSDLKQILLKQTKSEQKAEEKEFEMEMEVHTLKKVKSKAKVKKEAATKTTVFNRGKEFLNYILGPQSDGKGSDSKRGGDNTRKRKRSESDTSKSSSKKRQITLELREDADIIFFFEFCALYILFLTHLKRRMVETNENTKEIDAEINKINDAVNILYYANFDKIVAILDKQFLTKTDFEFKKYRFDEYINKKIGFYKEPLFDTDNGVIKESSYKPSIQLVDVFNNFIMYELFENTFSPSIGIFKIDVLPKIQDVLNNDNYNIAKTIINAFLSNQNIIIEITSTKTSGIQISENVYSELKQIITKNNNIEINDILYNNNNAFLFLFQIYTGINKLQRRTHIQTQTRRTKKTKISTRQTKRVSQNRTKRGLSRTSIQNRNKTMRILSSR